jgi:phospholipid/cholesterol/gamma-HCH transport system substrate-binding protein
MDTKAHYTVVGLVVVILGAALAATIVWLSVGLDRPVYNTFAVYTNQSVSGLSVEAPVRFNGVNVGYVKDISLNPENAQQVVLTLQVKTTTPITTSTVATLDSQGITGIDYIALRAKTANAPLMQIHNEPPYPSIPAEPSLLVQLSSLLKDTSSEFKGVSGSIQNVLDAENAENIKEILTHLNLITGNLAQNEAALESLIQNANQAAIQLNQATAMAREGMIPAISMINHLNTISGNLEVFSENVKENPSILVRGQTRGPLGPGEN